MSHVTGHKELIFKISLRINNPIQKGIDTAYVCKIDNSQGKARRPLAWQHCNGCCGIPTLKHTLTAIMLRYPSVCLIMKHAIATSCLRLASFQISRIVASCFITSCVFKNCSLAEEEEEKHHTGENLRWITFGSQSKLLEGCRGNPEAIDTGLVSLRLPHLCFCSYDLYS